MQSKWRLIGIIIWLVFFSVCEFSLPLCHHHRCCRYFRRHHTESSQFLALIQIHFFFHLFVLLDFNIWLGFGLSFDRIGVSRETCMFVLVGLSVLLLRYYNCTKCGNKNVGRIVQRTGICVKSVQFFFFFFDFAFPLHLNFWGGHRAFSSTS